MCVGNQSGGGGNEWLLATGCKGFDGTGCDIKVFDIRRLSGASTESYSILHELNGHRQDVTGCKFINERVIASVSRDGTFRSWDIQNRNASSTYTSKSHVLSDNANYTSITTVLGNGQYAPSYITPSDPNIEMCVTDRNGSVTVFTFSYPDMQSRSISNSMTEVTLCTSAASSSTPS
jgi:WD40 repeat protein